MEVKGYIFRHIGETEETAHKLKAFSALSEDWSLVFSTHTGQLRKPVTPAPEDSMGSSDLHRHQHTYAHFSPLLSFLKFLSGPLFPKSGI